MHTDARTCKCLPDREMDLGFFEKRGKVGGDDIEKKREQDGMT